MKPLHMSGHTYRAPRMGKCCLAWNANLNNKIKVCLNSQQLTGFKKAANSTNQDIFDIYAQVTSILSLYLITDSQATWGFLRTLWFDQDCRDMRHFLCTLQNITRTGTSIKDTTYSSWHTSFSTFAFLPKQSVRQVRLTDPGSPKMDHGTVGDFIFVSHILEQHFNHHTKLAPNILAHNTTQLSSVR